jgi:hypothetical protein
MSSYFFPAGAFLAPALLGACVKSDPAAVFAAGDDFGSRSTLPAADAAGAATFVVA